MARVDLHAVSELDEASQRVEEPLGALTSVHGEVRTCGVPDEQRVAGEDDPGSCPRARVAHRRGAVSSRCPGVWMHRSTT